MKKVILFAFFLYIATNPLSAQEQAVSTPVMGWSSWNTYRVNISESLIKKQADALVSSGLADKGYQYVNIDDGYFGGRDGSGKIKINSSRFPNGMKPVVNYIHAKGLKAGIYSDAGANTCGAFWDGDKWGNGVGFYGHDQQDADFFFKELGFDFIKVDFCGGDAKQNSEGISLDPRERYTAIYDAIVATGCEDVRLNVCRWAYPGTWVSDIASSWRIHSDISANWKSVQDIIATNLYRSAFARRGTYNDMDMLEVGRGMTQEEDNTHFGMWCMLSSPLIIGCDLTAVSEAALTLLGNEELIAVNQDTLGLQAHVVKYDRATYVLAKDLERRDSTLRAVAFYNPNDTPLDVEIDFALLDFVGNVQIRDLFSHKDLGSFTGTYSSSVPAHGCRIYRMEAEARSECTLYEAEAAWLSAFQDITNPTGTGECYLKTSNVSSGRYRVTQLGGPKGGDIVWDNVIAHADADYELTIQCLCGSDKQMTLEVNGQCITTFDVNTGGENVLGQVGVTVPLHKGINYIRLYNENDYMPDIDCLRVRPHRKESDAIISPDAHSFPSRMGQAYTLSGVPLAERPRRGIYVQNGIKRLGKH